MISVIIPVLNEQDRIGELLESINQIPTQIPYEIIVVDGGSQDQTVEIAARSAVVYQVTNGNRGKQMRYGAKKSRGDILWFLHSDSEFEIIADLFAQMKKVLDDPKTSAGFFRLRFQGEGWFYRYLEKTSHWRARYLGLIFGDQGLFLKRIVYDQAGGFDEVPLMEDWLLSRRLKKLGRFAPLDIVLSTSPRRFESGKLKTHLEMHKIKLLFLLGVPPEELVKRYYKRRP